jgi:hypothetical protein
MLTVDTFDIVHCQVYVTLTKFQTFVVVFIAAIN